MSGVTDDPVLTRDLLASGAVAAMIARASPELTVLTDAEREESLRATLAARPAGADTWLFAYGSLIWNPTIRFAERRVARVHGWHRAFCLSTRAGRGTPDNPGLVLGLDRGGSCAGAAFRLEPSLVAAELSLLWRREMVSGSYQPRWLLARGGDGAAFGHAVAFTIRRDRPTYAGKLAPAELVRRLATAAGELGSSADYLRRTREGLRALGIRDPGVERLADAVERLGGTRGPAGASGPAKGAP